MDRAGQFGGILIGRDAELSRAWSALAQERSIVVEGERGLGRTALLRTLSAGRATCWCSGFASVQSPRHLPCQILGRDLIRGSPQGEVARELHRALGEELLVVDDAHLVARAAWPLLEILCTKRSVVVSLDQRDARSALLRERLVADGAAMITLRPLAPTDARRIVRGLRPEWSKARRQRVVAASDGVPLLLVANCAVPGAHRMLAALLAEQSSAFPGDSNGTAGSRPAGPRAAVLTRREGQFVEMAARGWTSAQIASRCGVRATTVDRTIGSAMRRLGARTRSHAIAVISLQDPRAGGVLAAADGLH